MRTGEQRIQRASDVVVVVSSYTTDGSDSSDFIHGRKTRLPQIPRVHRLDLGGLEEFDANMINPPSPAAVRDAQVPIGSPGLFVTAASGRPATVRMRSNYASVCLRAS
jgi:hypothetical protein